MANNPRRANGTRRNRLRRRILTEESDCAICGQPVDKTIPYPDPWSPTIDEIVPVSLGGDPLDRANCRLAHFRCNVQRGNGTKPTPQSVKRVRAY
jgi:5-methylcytosine-specific restriction endonuclease McrA